MTPDEATAKAREIANDVLYKHTDVGNRLRFADSAKLGEAIAHALLDAQREAVEACVRVAKDYSDFTGANYCDHEHAQYDRSMEHDYGRGGCHVRKGIAAALAALLPKETPRGGYANGEQE